jgi:hypothetical protein
MGNFSVCLRRVSAAVGLVAGLVAAAVGCGNDDERDVFVGFQTRELSAEGRPTLESGCMSVRIRSDGEESFSGSAPASGGVDEHGNPILPDFIVDRAASEKGVRVLVRSAGQPIELKFYDVVFLDAGRMDRFVVTTRAGKQFEVAHRGTHVFDTSEFLAAEDLPGRVIAP